MITGICAVCNELKILILGICEECTYGEVPENPEEPDEE